MPGPAPLPKPKSGALRALWEAIVAVLDVPRTIVVLEGALDRRALEDLTQQLFKGVRATGMPRAQLVGQLADIFHRGADLAIPILRDLDKSCSKERHIVASIDEDSLADRLTSYRALDFRRERARLVWALLRDGREAHRSAADRILSETFVGIAEAATAHAAVEAGAVPSPDEIAMVRTRLEKYESVIAATQREVAASAGQVAAAERERSELLARVAQREHASRGEEGQRRQVEAERDALRERVNALEDELKRRDPARVAALEDELDKQRDKTRALERRAAHAEGVEPLREELADAARALEEERRQNAALRASAAEREAMHKAETQRFTERLEATRHELHEARRQLAERPAGPAPGTAPDAVGVFVDAENLSASARRDLQSKLDFAALLPLVVDERPRAVAIAFVVQPDGDDGPHRAFVSALRGYGYEVRERRVKVRPDGSRKADWDMGIAMEILDALPSLGVVVLCSGDGDFLPLVRRLKKEGRRVEIAAFRSSTDEGLLRAADLFTALDGRLRL